MLADLGAQARAPSDASCRFDAATGTLALTASRTVTHIVRSGDEIRFTADKRSVSCGATKPTVENVDTITVDSNAEFAVDLRNGQFAPGRTPESDGSSEIEISGRFRTTGGVRVLGTAGRDRIGMGEVDGRRAVNLNGREGRPDPDLYVSGGFVVVSVVGRGGGDRIKATGGRGFDGPLETPITVSAGPGRDRVIGTDRRDLIGGGAGNDLINPEGGHDHVRAQGGADRLKLKDRKRDFATCGHGRDRVKADRIDRLSGC
jgi:hypothetical protein